MYKELELEGGRKVLVNAEDYNKWINNLEKQKKVKDLVDFYNPTPNACQEKSGITEKEGRS